MCPNAKTNSIALYIKGNDNHSISVNLYGKYHCKLASVWFYLNDKNSEKIIQFVSPQFRLQYLGGTLTLNANNNAIQPYFASAYPVVVANSNHQVGGLDGAYEWSYEFNGQIELQMKKIGGDAINVNDISIINLELTKLDN